MVVIICKSGFLDFVHRLYFNKITTFRKLDLLPSTGKEEGQKPWLLGPLVELASDLDLVRFCRFENCQLIVFNF
jgi:hypothetical protein